MTRDCPCFACQCEPNQVTKDAIREAREMTHHDELLAICDNYSFKDSAEPVKALRAVVELHKPTDLITPYEIRCDDCLDEYPCPTIQAIEKELK